MNDLTVFNNPDFGEIRSMLIDSEPWFVGKDVAKSLGYKDTPKAIRDHVDDEDKRLLRVGDLPTLKVNNYGAYIINESGVYALIFSSKLPTARQFKRWVTSEVLPAIRKTGSYAVMTAPQPVEHRELTADDYLKAASIVAGCRNERLPYVLGFLEQGGFPIPEIMSPDYQPTDVDDALCLLREAKNNRGMTYEQIGKIIGLDRVQVGRYYSGVTRPKPQRAAFILKRLQDALSQLD